MSVLKKLEEKIQSLFEGSFGRAFKSPVQPVELARKLVKEMEDNKVVSVSRIYAPNEYTLFLSPDDAAQFDAYEDHLKKDLADYLLENARRDKYELLSQPVVIIKTDEDLQVGEFGIATRMVSGPEEVPEAPATEPELGQTVIYRPPAPAEGTMAVGADEAKEMGLAHEQVTLTAGDIHYKVDKRVVLIGRGKHADLIIPDSNVSRSHAELRLQGNEYHIVDLDSTNGVEVNGKKVRKQTLYNGDLITLGTTRVRFERKLC